MIQLKFECSICGADKPLEDYHKNSVNQKSWPNECKRCKINRKEQYRIDSHNQSKRYNENRKFQEEYKRYQELKTTPEGRKKLKCSMINKHRRKTDPLYRLTGILSGQIYRLSRGVYKTNQDAKCLERTKVTEAELLAHLEKSLLPGDTMEDFVNGKYDVDHKIPKVWFIWHYGMDNVDKISEMNHIENLHLLPKKDNMSKGARYGYGPNKEIIYYKDWVKTLQVPTQSH